VAETTRVLGDEESASEERTRERAATPVRAAAPARRAARRTLVTLGSAGLLIGLNLLWHAPERPPAVGLPPDPAAPVVVPAAASLEAWPRLRPAPPLERRDLRKRMLPPRLAPARTVREPERTASASAARPGRPAARAAEPSREKPVPKSAGAGGWSIRRQ
jgi:hypothetical protein